MSTTPTAEEFFNQYGGYTREEMLLKSIEFAKLHVEAALKEASNKSKRNYSDSIIGGCPECGCDGIDEYCILNSYPLSNIK